MVWPTKSGKIVEERDQVLTTFFLPDLFISTMRFISAKPALGLKTRKHKKYSNKMIVKRAGK